MHAQMGQDSKESVWQKQVPQGEKTGARYQEGNGVDDESSTGGSSIQEVYVVAGLGRAGLECSVQDSSGKARLTPRCCVNGSREPRALSSHH